MTGLKHLPSSSWIDRLMGRGEGDRAQLTREANHAVTEIFRALPQDKWRVWHDLPLGPNHELDHLLVGTGGIFSVTTLGVPAQITVSGRAMWFGHDRVDLIPDVVNHATVVRTKLSEALDHRVSVRAMIVLACHSLSIDTPPHDVVVIRKQNLARWLGHAPHEVPLSHVVQLSKVAGLEETWS
jgi:hypothetical protein